MNSILFYDTKSGRRHNASTLRRAGLTPASEGVYPLKNIAPAHNARFETYSDLGTVSGDPECGFQIEYQVVLRSFSHCADKVSTQISERAEQALALLEQGYTEREIKTWPQQRAEAAALLADNGAEVPLLAQLAQHRGLPLATLVEKVQSKVTTAAQQAGTVLGDAQAATDQINTLKQLAATDQLPDDWFDQLQAIHTGWNKNWPGSLTTDINKQGGIDNAE